MAAKILIVDDSATVRQQVALAMAQANFEVIEAVDGLDGKEKIEQVAGLGLVVCDINMPRLNGIEMIEQVKQDPRFAKLPILVLTTEGDQALIARAKRAGAAGWIVKPFKADRLVNAAKALTAA